MGPAEASSSSPARLDYLPPISHITQQLEELLNHVNSALGHGGAGLGSPATSPLRAGLGASSPVGRFGLGLGPSPGAASQAPTEWYRPASPGLGGLARVLDTAFGRPASPGTGGSPPPPASLAALFPPPPPGADVQSVLRQLATVQRDVDALRRNVMAERAGGVATGSRPGTSGAGGGAGAGSVHFGWTSPPRAGSPGAESPLHGGVAPAAQGPHAPTLQHQRETSSPASYASSVSLLGEQQHPAPPPLARLASPPPSQAQVIRSFGSSFLTSGSLPATLHPGHTAASLRTLAAPPPRRLARIEPLSVVLPSRRRSVSPRAATGMTSPLDNDPQQVEAIVEALGTIRHSLTALGDSVEGLQDIVAAGSSSAGSSPRRPGSRYGRQRRRYSHDELHGGDHSGDWHERGGTGPVDLTGVLPGGRGSRYGSPRRSSEESQRDGIRYEGITDVERRSRSQSRSASPSSSAAGSPRQGRYEVDYGAQGASSRPGSRGRAYAYRTALGATVAHLRAAGGLSPQAGAAAGSGQWPFSQRPQSPTTSPSAARTLQLSPSGAGGRRMHAWDSYLDAGQAAAASPVNGLMVAMPAGKLRVHGSPPRSPSSPSRSRARVLNSSLTAPAAAAGMLAEGRMAPARAGASGGGHTTTTFTPRSQQAAQAAPAAHTFRPAGAMERASPAAAQRTSAAAAAPAATAGAAARGRSSGRPRLMPVEAIVTAFIDAARQAAAIEPLEALPAPNYVRTSGGGYGSPAGSRPPSPGGLPSSALIEDDGLVLTSIVSATAPLERYTAADVLHTLAATPAVPQARGPPASVAASSASDRGSRAAAPASRAHEETRDLHVLLQGMRTLPGAGGGGGSTATAAATGGGGGTTGGRSLSPSLAAMHAETRARLREAGLPVSRLGLAGTAVGAVSAGRLSSTLGGEQRDGGASAAMVGSQAGHAAQRPLAPLSTSSLLASHTPAGSNIRSDGAFDGEACAEVGELSFIALAPELRRQALARAGLVSSDQGSVEPPSSDLDSPAWAGEAGMQIDPQHGSGAESSGGEGGGESELLLTLRAPAPVAAAPAQSGERLRGMLELLTELELVPDPQLDLNPDLHVELGLELGLVSHEALLLGQAGDDGLLGPLALGMAAAAAPSPQVNRMRRPVAAAAHTAEAAGTEAEAIAGVAQMPPGNVLPAQRSLQRALEEDLAAAATPSSVDSGAPCAADEDADVQEEIGSLESAMARAGASPSASTGDTAAGTMPDTDRALGEPGATPVVVPAAAPVQSGARQPLALLQRLHAVAEESRARQQLLLLASPALSLAREHATLANEQASSDGGGASGSSHATDAPGAGIEAAESPAVLVSFGSEQYGSPDKLPNTTSGPAPMDSVADRSPQSAPVDWGELPQAQAAIEPARSAGIPEPADTTALQRRAESHTPDAAAPPAAGTVGCLQPSPVPEPQAPTAAADRTPAGRTAGRMWGLSGGGMAASAAAARSTTPRYAAVPDSPESPAVSSAMAASSGQAGGVVDGSLGEAEDTDSSAGERDEGSSGQGAGGAAAAAPVGRASWGPLTYTAGGRCVADCSTGSTRPAATASRCSRGHDSRQFGDAGAPGGSPAAVVESGRADGSSRAA
ncbi:hypothetical protein HXX76_000311 [Chlamydomonas incerta]|uniref:Uncharacterized protein n=1 Tax=Chlamydomonas incerta TaxID=51695 RepID=A0A836B2V4_CHLIN|nr:hypothetical protein HXX76_000311 [Chlamydomonas incerta]|eukprot:KAG2445704.1 hypothetical protein HXX76_000311 [Chlamydomonas incerta]